MLILAKLFFFLTGWKYTGKKPSEDKFVIIVAPHTSNMDFFLGRLTASILRIKIYFLMKQEVFFFPFGIILKILHAVPINRKKPSDMINKLVSQFKEQKKFVLVITPEGTRKKVSHWKKGFYYIACKASVPIVPCGLNYKEKNVILGEPIYPSGDEKTDWNKIMQFFVETNLDAKHPENFQLPKISA